MLLSDLILNQKKSRNKQYNFSLVCKKTDQNSLCQWKEENGKFSTNSWYEMIANVTKNGKVEVNDTKDDEFIIVMTWNTVSMGTDPLIPSVEQLREKETAMERKTAHKAGRPHPASC